MPVNRFTRTYNGLFRHDEWNVGVVRAPIRVLLEGKSKPKVNWFPFPKSGTFLADPFGIVKDQKVHLLCEQFDYGSYKGRIVSMEFTDKDSPSEPEVVFELPVHVSYPYLFERQERVYCVPETFQAREIGLYEIEDFPRKWLKVAVLVDNFAGLDGTVFQYDGYWWLACSNRELGALDKLFLFYSDDLLGTWKPHDANPVKTDISSSRPAGTPVFHEGSLYRPAQDCSKVYGGRIVFNRVTRLTPTDFREEPVAFVEPDETGPYPAGMHTLSVAGDITIVDGHRLRFIRSAFESMLRRRLAGRIAGKQLVVPIFC